MLLVASALAHVPHDNVASLAAPGALDGATPWYVLADPQGSRLLLRSDDAGRTFAFIGGEPIADEPDAIALLDDGTLVVLGDTRLWWTEDEGATWASETLPAELVAIRGGEALVLAGPGGIWEGIPGALTQVFERPVIALGPGPVAIDDARSVWVRSDAGWEGLTAPDAVLTAAAGDGSAVYAGARDGTLWRWDGGWSACGGLEADERPAILSLVVADGAVVAANAETAGWTSTDDCATWEARTAPIEVLYGVEGGAETEEASWPVLAAAGRVRVAAGWGGLFTSQDAGETWIDAPIVPPDHTRGITFSDAFSTDGLIYVGGYGAGVLRTADGGRTIDAPDHGMAAENVQRIVTTGDPSDTATLYAISGHVPWRSADHGTTWTAFGERFDTVDELVTWCSADHVWIFDGPDTGVVETTDGGATWTTVSLPLDLSGSSAEPATPGGAVRVGESVCVTTHHPASVMCGDGGAWQVYTGSGKHSPPPIGWPPAAPTRVVFGDASGLHMSADGGHSWTTVWEGDLPTTLAAADDGTLFAGTLSGSIVRSDDGGETWTASTWRLTATPSTMAARPAFATHPDLLVGTHDGTWLVSGDAAPVRFGGWQRIDDASEFWRGRSLPDPIVDPAASMDSLQPVPEGAALIGWLRGDRLRVIGASDGIGRLLLVVDDVEIATLGETATDGIGVLAEVDGFGEGWHLVRLVGVTSGAAIDAVEAWGEGAVLDGIGDGVAPPPGPCTPVDPQLSAVGSTDCGEGCGDGCGGDAAGALLLAGLLRARRARRP